MAQLGASNRPAGRLQDHFHLKAVEDFTSDGDLLSLPRDKTQGCKGRFCGEARVDPQQAHALGSSTIEKAPEQLRTDLRPRASALLQAKPM